MESLREKTVSGVKWQVASKILQFVHLDHLPGVHASGLLPFLRHPTVVDSHEASGIPNAGINTDSNGHRSPVKRIYGRLCDFTSIKDGTWRQTADRYESEIVNFLEGNGNDAK